MKSLTTPLLGIVTAAVVIGMVTVGIDMSMHPDSVLVAYSSRN